MNKRQNLMIVCSMIVVLFAFLSGCQTPPTSTPAPAGSLSGIVSDASNGSPIGNAQITVAGQSGVFNLVSDASGMYRADKLLPGAYLVNVQATGYYANAIQVGVVADVASAANIALTPASAPVEAVINTPMPTIEPPTPEPAIPTPTAETTETPEPTATTTPTPTPTAAPAVRSGTRPTPCTPSSSSRYAAPRLIEPLDYSTFHGIRRITFEWEGTCCLADDEYYVVSIPHPRGVEEGWVKGTSWTAPDYLYLLLPESKQLTWSVSIRRHTGQYPNGQWTGPIVSPISERWHFSWEVPGGQISPLANTSPLAAP